MIVLQKFVERIKSNMKKIIFIYTLLGTYFKENISKNIKICYIN
jgi:hypothetical protein